MIRIYPALVLKSTLLEEYYLTGQYTPLSLEEAIEWCTGILPLYREAKIKVLRMGLQDSDTLESSVVAGPYHPAFGELVESRILYKRITKWLDMHLNNQKRIISGHAPGFFRNWWGRKEQILKASKKNTNYMM